LSEAVGHCFPCEWQAAPRILPLLQRLDDQNSDHPVLKRVFAESGALASPLNTSNCAGRGNLAYWNHRKLRWDPKKWQFVDDDKAAKWLDRDRRDPSQLPKL
jgi:hypothetical protein